MLFLFCLCSVQPFDDLIYGTHRENGVNDTWDSEESEDSNDENNWRNDYPDTEEEDEESVGESDIRLAVENMDLEGDRELSSDDGNGFVYSIDAEAIGFEDDIDYCDVNRYGEAYARYKKRVINKTYNGGYDYDNSDDSDDDSDDDGEIDEDGNKKEITSDLDELDNFEDSH